MACYATRAYWYNQPKWAEVKTFDIWFAVKTALMTILLFKFNLDHIIKM